MSDIHIKVRIKVNTRKAVAAVSVGTYSTWKSTATLRLLGGARGAWAPTGEEGRGILCRYADSLLIVISYAAA